ncbi:MAG: amino acid permease [Candidatus Paracaedibacteraceae bacterium]|nr:amino acid permease [Candidatus Paracaedibacteraceae bacterium]
MTKPLRVFGFWTATSLVLGNMIGSGIFYLPASLAHVGPISVLGWMITAIGAISLAYVFSKLSLHNPSAGGPFSFTRQAYGDEMGFFMAWGYWIMAWSSNAAVSLAFVSYLSHFIPYLAESKIASFGVATALIWLTTFLNCRNLKYGGFVQVLTVIIKISPLIAVALVGWYFIDVNNYTPFNPNHETPLEAINAAAAITMWAFIGLESATVPAENVENPGKTISRATLFGTLLGALIYIIITAVIFGLIPSDKLAQSNAPFVDAAILIFGSWIAPLVGFCVLVSIFGGLNGWIIMQGQIPYALAKEGLFPKAFKKLSDNGTPVFGLVFTSVLMTILMSMNYSKSLVSQFNNMILIGTIMTLGTYLSSALASIKLLGHSFTAKLKPQVILAVFLGSAYCIWAIFGSGLENLMICFIAYVCGIPVYIFSKWQNRRTGNS